MVTIATSTDTFRSIEKIRVDTASKIIDNSWTEQPSLHVNRLSTVAGPDIDTAELEFDYGIYADQSKVSPLSLDRSYVRIILRDTDSEPDNPTVTQMKDNAFLVWYGIIEVDERDAGGTRTINDVVVPTGTQKFTAYGLLRELELTFVTESVVEKSGGGFQTINRGIPFNLQKGSQFPDRGNSTELTGGPAGTTPIFSFAPFTDDDSNRWDAQDALQYTLEYDAPKDINGIKVYEWQTFFQGFLLDWFDITVERDSRSVKDIIDDLLDRRRLVGYYVQGIEDASGFHAELNVFSFNDKVIDLGRTQQIMANPRQFTLDFESSFDVEIALLSNNSAHRADVVNVRGAPITTTFSCFRQGGFLETAWSSADETTFVDGAKNTAGYADLSIEDKQKRNQIARSLESLKDVYEKFVIADDWDLVVPDDIEGEGSSYYVAVETVIAENIGTRIDFDFDASDANNIPAELWHKGKRFLRFLPIREDDTDDLSEYKDPLVVFRTDEGPPKVWEFGDKLNTKSAFAADDDVRQFSARLIMLEKELGFRVEVGAAGAQQLIAFDDWALQTPETTKEEYDPLTTEGNGVSNQNMIVTVALEWDNRVIETAFPSNPPSQAELQSKQARELFIDVPDARLDFILPGTVTDIDDAGALVQSPNGKILRDDRFRLSKIAKVAAEWYGVKRQALQLRYRQLRPPTNGTDKIQIGDLITSIGAVYSDPDVNSVVTSITYEFIGSPTTTLETSFAHLDLSNANLF